IAVLADDTGAIFPYIGNDFRFSRLDDMNVTLNDALCGATVNGESRLILTTTPFVPTSSILRRVDVDAPTMSPINFEANGSLADPAPYDDGHALMVRHSGGVSTVELVDITGVPLVYPPQSAILATVQEPYFAA